MDVHKALRIAYLVLISIAASYVTMYIFLSPLAKYSGAEMGLLGFVDQPLHVMGSLKVNLKSHDQIFLIVGGVALLMIAWLHRIASSPAGMIMRAIRENEVRVGFLGYNTFRFKLLVYTISGFVASVAGCLYLLRSGFISVDVFRFQFHLRTRRHLPSRRKERLLRPHDRRRHFPDLERCHQFVHRLVGPFSGRGAHPLRSLLSRGCGPDALFNARGC